MQNRIIDTAKHTLIYGIGNVSTKVIGLLLLPLYTAKLSVLNYGKFTILEVTSQFLVILISMNISSAMLRWCSSETNINEERKIISTSFFTLITIISLFLFICLPLSTKFSQLYFQTNDYNQYFVVLFLSISFEIINGIPLSILRYQEKSKKYNIIIVIRVTAMLSLNIMFLAFLDMGILGIFLSNLISQIIVFLLLLPKLIPKIKLEFEYKVFYEMACYSMPLIFSSLSLFLLSVGDRFIISHFLTYSEVGIYSLAYKIAGVINMLVIQSFAMGFLPIAYKMFNDQNARIFYRRIFKYYSFSLVFIALIISIFSRELLEVVAKQKDYWIANQYVPILSLAFVIKGLQYIFTLGFHYLKKTKLNAIIIVIGVLINIILNIILIPKWALWGAASSTLFSTIFITVLIHHYSSKMYNVNYQIKRLTILIVVSIMLYLTTIYFGSEVFYFRILMKILLIFIFFIATFKLYLNQAEQIKLIFTIRQFIHKNK